MAADETTLCYLRWRTTLCAQGANLPRAATRERASPACNGLGVGHRWRFWNVFIFAKARGGPKEHFGVWMQWRIEKRIGINHLHQFAAIQDRDSVSQLPHDGKVMGDKQHGDAVLLLEYQQ